MRLRLTAEVLPLLTTISPLIGVATVAAARRWSESVVRPMALSNSAMTLLLAAACVWSVSQPRAAADARSPRPVPGVEWLAVPAPELEGTGQAPLRGIRVRLSGEMDGLSAWSSLVLSLTVWAALCCLGQRDGSFSASTCAGLMATQALLLGSFFSTDAVAALVLLQAAVLPMYLLIGIAGGDDRRPAAGAWWTWQMIGGSCSLVGVTLLGVSQPWMQADLVAERGAALFETSRLVGSLQQLLGRSETAWHQWGHVAPWGAALLLLGLMIRLPVFPFQGWYASTLVAAPAGVAAVIAVGFPLAALVDWLRLGMPLFGQGNAVAGTLCLMSMIGALQASLAIRWQTDLKRRLATTGCTALCLVGIGLSLPGLDGVRSAWMLFLSLGLVTAGGMLVVHVMEVRCETRDLTRLWAPVKRYPRLAWALTIVLLSVTGIPLASGFPALVLQMWASAGSGLWIVVGQSIALLAVASAGIDGFVRLMASEPVNKAGDIAPQVVRTGSERGDLGAAELMPLAAILALLVLLNAAPGAVMDSCEPVLDRIFRTAGSPSSSVSVVQRL